MTIAMAKSEFFLFENKAELQFIKNSDLQFIEIVILIGQFQSDRAF